MQLDLRTLVAALAALAAFLSVLALMLPAIRRDALAGRLKAVAQRREDLRQRRRAAVEGPGLRSRMRRGGGWAKALVDRLRLHDLADGDSLRLQLVQAGWRDPAAPWMLAAARAGLPLVGALLAGLWTQFGVAAAWSGNAKAAAVLAGAALGYYLPQILLRNAAARRRAALRRALPDGLDLMLICVEAGLSIEAAFARVSEEVGKASPVLAEEFALTSAELAFLSDRAAALGNLAHRTGLPQLRALASALQQAERYGTPLVQALRVLAQESRDGRMALAEKTAAALPPKLTVPMIAFFLPALFVVILGPAAIQYLMR